MFPCSFQRVFLLVIHEEVVRFDTV